MLDRAPPSPKPLPAPGSKCRCQCEVTGFNPCETELRLEKLRRRSTDIDKVQGISVMLRQALENADIRRLSSNTNRVSTHLKTLEQGDQNLCNITLEQDRGAKVKEQAGAGKEHSSPSLSPSPALNHTTTSSRSEETRQTDRQGELSNTVCEDGCSGSLSAVSPPLRRSVFGRSGEGAWFSDPMSQDSPLYVAPLLFGSTLLEFRDMDVLARGEPLSPPHTLPASYSGSGHTVYNSSFYYLKAFTRTLIRYSLVQRCLCAWSELSELPSPSHGHGWRGHNEVTLGADEGGLWVAYPSLLEGELMLRKLDSEELLPRRGEGGEKAAWSTGLGRQRYGLCFLVCGVLYVLERGAESEGVVFHAFDSHTGSHTSPALPFPARPATTLLTQLSYNPRDRLLYGWDDGALLTYSLEFTY
ncbi:olfactomedin-like protein 2A [Acipenser ruthenus]|uniref:olfactomedin-like protein 2A n=1 Tax=Acipenser ruthenus TaxID=7906 RepID=UPI0027404616|nr:olfactomedin-like protein 2A [Acipenser ruthenus]